MSVEITGIEETLIALTERLNVTREQANHAVMLGGMAYQADVQKLAPVDTGQYRASIRTEPVAGEIAVIVGTDKPQACRLEFGFFDMTDSLGRHFYQIARPHFRPPLDLNKDRYIRIMKDSFGAPE